MAGIAARQGAADAEHVAEGGDVRGNEPEPTNQQPLPEPSDTDATTPTTPLARRRLRHTKQRRDLVRSVRLSHDELATIEHAADLTHMTVAGFIATAAVTIARDTDAVQATVTDQRALVQELMTAGTQLARVANNVNQIARVLNSGGDPTEANATLALLRTAVARLEDAALAVARQ